MIEQVTTKIEAYRREGEHFFYKEAEHIPSWTEQTEIVGRVGFITALSHCVNLI